MKVVRFINSRWGTYILLAWLLYCAVAQYRYRFLHPEMTETQLFRHIGDYLLWR